MSDTLRAQRISEINEIKDKGINPFVHEFERSHTTAQFAEEFSVLSPEQTVEEKIVRCAGRVVAIRDHGKSSFFVISDFYGKLQAYIRLAGVGAENYDFYKKHISIGDYVGVVGFPFRSKTGELSVYVQELILLTKTIRPLPEKWHGIKDKEVIYRQRYVDLISNEESMRRFKIRFEAIKLIREFMNRRKFVEVETPMLQYVMGGASARPFVTHMNTYDIDLYLRIAPELYLKRLIVGGFDRVYEINRNFRNEGVSYKHSPEFTMMECYQAYADYEDMMELTESLLSSVVKELFGKYTITYQGMEINFEPPWERVSMVEFIERHLQLDVDQSTNEQLLAFLSSRHEEPELKDRGHLIEALWDLVEDKVQQPTFITDHPIEISPLAKKHRSKPGVTERFELIIYGREMANAFSELNDPIDQYQRFEGQVKLRDSGDEEAQMMDLDYIRALEFGLPPTGGLGIGIDRFIMFLADAPTIRDIIAFPMVRPEMIYQEYDEEDEGQKPD
jgi:lysyl-tRNA synthetase class 2